MNILITGDAGFIGSHLKAELINQGYHVVGYDLVRGEDILDLEKLSEFIRNSDVVFHLAAEANLSKMGESIEDARRGALTNVEGTHNVAYLCAKYNKWLIYSSTVSIYGNETSEPSREDFSLPNPKEIYASSKYSGEVIIRGYGSSYNMPWTILRFATIYGEKMKPSLGLYIFFKQAILGEPITVHGNGNQTRTLTYIGDLIKGIIATLNFEESSKRQVFNLSSTDSISANQMAEDVKDIVKSSSKIIHIPQRLNQTMLEYFDVSKAKETLEWETQTSWRDGLSKTYEWIRSQF